MIVTDFVKAWEKVMNLDRFDLVRAVRPADPGRPDGAGQDGWVSGPPGPAIRATSVHSTYAERSRGACAGPVHVSARPLTTFTARRRPGREAAHPTRAPTTGTTAPTAGDTYARPVNSHLPCGTR